MKAFDSVSKTSIKVSTVKAGVKIKFIVTINTHEIQDIQQKFIDLEKRHSFSRGLKLDDVDNTVRKRKKRQ